MVCAAYLSSNATPRPLSGTVTVNSPEAGDVDDEREQQDLRECRSQPTDHGQRQQLRGGRRCDCHLRPCGG